MGIFRFIVNKHKVVGALLDDIFFSVKDFGRNTRLYQEYKSFRKRRHIKEKRKP
ncbi:hypothetical protein [Candidatus Magnetobacterium casense]|uniref:Uncharacterized protein n=1 Tax=Candidatus Magnetobacterium casense TaxID=1455061 RepID=A0ABS6RWN9_9BACT|nr:hypothetical protein [Candidatus Magnetobacterium casensis]MBV6341037.1 hypothetical protein [Candidatus Magnetobacterium casensis]